MSTLCTRKEYDEPYAHYDKTDETDEADEMMDEMMDDETPETMSPKTAAGWLGTMVDASTPPMTALALRTAIEVLEGQPEYPEQSGESGRLPEDLSETVAQVVSDDVDAPVFDAGSIVRVVQSMNYRKAFYAFVQRRFYEVAALGCTFETETAGSVTIADLPEDHWTDYRVPAGWEDGYTSLLVQEPYIPVQRFTKNPESGNEIAGAVVMFDLDVLFDVDDHDDNFRLFQSLKERFDFS